MFDGTCSRCGRFVGDKDSVRSWDGRILCYICARYESGPMSRGSRYYDDDRKEFNEYDDGKDRYIW